MVGKQYSAVLAFIRLPREDTVSFVVRTLVNAAALWVADELLTGISREGDWVSLLLVALVLGVVNGLVRPILKVLTCPLQIVTLGLFTFVINGVMLLLTSWISGKLGLAFHVGSFWDASLGGLIISIVNMILSALVKKDRRR
jgi:putative membrane protein